MFSSLHFLSTKLLFFAVSPLPIHRQFPNNALTGCFNRLSKNFNGWNLFHRFAIGKLRKIPKFDNISTQTIFYGKFFFIGLPPYNLIFPQEKKLRPFKPINIYIYMWLFMGTIFKSKSTFRSFSHSVSSSI